MGRTTGVYCKNHPAAALTALYARKGSKYKHIGYICPICLAPRITPEGDNYLNQP